MTTPLGVRRHNPGNLVRSGVPWVGKLPPDGNRFESFDTAEHGIQALASNLLAYQRGHGIRTVRAAINRWAPPVENDTGAYVNAVAKAIGYGPDEPLDFSDPGILLGLTRAIIRHENGQQPYSDAQLATAIGAALGIRPQDVPRPAQEGQGEAIATPEVSIPIPTEKKPMLPLLLPALLQMIPQLVTVFGKGGERATQNAQAAQIAVDVVTKATEAVNLQAALEKMQADPATKTAATAAVLREPAIAALLEATEAGGGGIAAARRQAADPAATPFWKSAPFYVSLLLMALVGAVVADVLFVHPGNWRPEDRAQVLMFAVAIASAVSSYFLGSSISSARKDTALLAQR